MSSLHYQPFPHTHWSLVRRAGAPDAAARHDALATLLARYQPALRSYLRVVRKIPPDEADELLQSFIADQLLEHDLLRRADQARGRFRTLLLTSLNNFVVSRGRHARRRAAEPLAPEAHAAADPAPDLAVQAAWARALVHEVLHALERQCALARRPDIWLVFQGRILAEVFGTGRVVPYEELAAQLQLSSPAQAANLLVTAKRMYARLLRLAVGEYECRPEDVDAEIADLRQTLADGAGACSETLHE